MDPGEKRLRAKNPQTGEVKEKIDGKWVTVVPPTSGGGVTTRFGNVDLGEDIGPPPESGGPEPEFEAGKHVMQGATLGTSDEAMGVGAEAAGNAPKAAIRMLSGAFPFLGAAAGALLPEDEGSATGDAPHVRLTRGIGGVPTGETDYGVHRDVERGALEASRTAHPGKAFLAEMFGGLAPTLAGSGLINILRGAAAADAAVGRQIEQASQPFVRRAARAVAGGAKGGGLTGGAAGVGYSEGETPMEVLGDAAEGVATGSVIGGLTGGVGEAILSLPVVGARGIGRRLWNRMTDREQSTPGLGGAMDAARGAGVEPVPIWTNRSRAKAPGVDPSRQEGLTQYPHSLRKPPEMQRIFDKAKAERAGPAEIAAEEAERGITKALQIKHSGTVKSVGKAQREFYEANKDVLAPIDDLYEKAHSLRLGEISSKADKPLPLSNEGVLGQFMDDVHEIMKQRPRHAGAADTVAAGETVPGRPGARAPVGDLTPEELETLISRLHDRAGAASHTMENDVAGYWRKLAGEAMGIREKVYPELHAIQASASQALEGVKNRLAALGLPRNIDNVNTDPLGGDASKVFSKIYTADTEGNLPVRRAIQAILKENPDLAASVGMVKGVKGYERATGMLHDPRVIATPSGITGVINLADAKNAVAGMKNIGTGGVRGLASTAAAPKEALPGLDDENALLWLRIMLGQGEWGSEIQEAQRAEAMGEEF